MISNLLYLFPPLKATLVDLPQSACGEDWGWRKAKPSSRPTVACQTHPGVDMLAKNNISPHRSALSSQKVNLPENLRQQPVVFNRQDCVLFNVLWYIYVDNCTGMLGTVGCWYILSHRDAASYFKVQYDTKSFCRMAKLLRRNHTAVPVSPFGPFIKDHAKAESKGKWEFFWSANRAGAIDWWPCTFLISKS